MLGEPVLSRQRVAILRSVGGTRRTGEWMTDPWAPPPARAPDGWAGPTADPIPRPDAAAFQAPVPVGLSVRSVPDGRAPIPAVWWVPLVAVLVLSVTTAAVLPGSSRPGLALAAIAVSIVGYVVVWSVVRPGRLRLAPRLAQTAAALGQDFSAPATVPLPLVGAVPERRVRHAVLLCNSAVVVFGLHGAWSFLVAFVVRARTPRIHQSRTVFRGLFGAAVDALATSVLEECGIAILILAVAGLAGKYFPRGWDLRSIGFTAILVATVVRTALHIPLWGFGAFGRIGLSFLLAWLFWRTRRIWPLILAHVLWDTLTFQTVVSPSRQLREFAALTLLAWIITGTVIGGLALSHSRKAAQRAAN